MKRIKELNEKRHAAIAAANAIVTTARNEKRELNADELTKLDGFHAEAERITSTITAEARQLSIESQRAPSLSRGEERDVASFSLGKLLRHLGTVVKGGSSQLDGIEAEMLQEGEAEARSADIKASGLMLPRILVRRGGYNPEQRTMSVTGGTNTQYGGDLVSTQKVGLADDFYNGSILRANGAMVLEGLVGNLGLPRYVKPSDPVKKTENQSADELSPEVTELALQPRRLPAFIDISEQLMRQSDVALETFVRRSLTEQMLAVQEVAFFHGGGTNEPRGIAATVGIGSVIGGTNGAAPDWADIVDLETKVSVLNAAVGRLHYLTNSKVRGQLKKTPVVASTDSRMIWTGADLNGYAPLVTNAISSTLVKGSSGAVCSAIFFGNVSDFVIGYWGGLSLELIRDTTNAKLGQFTLVANAYYDGGVLRPKSFAAMLDATTPGV
jgi:HK97 family phage major capsid protein